MSNRNKISQFFITYPQWVKYESPKKVLDFLPPCKWAYIVQENHEDNGIHYHVACIVKYPITKAKMLSFLKGYFPLDYKRIDVQAMQSVKSSIEYLQKESLIFYEHGNRPAQSQARPVQSYAQKLIETMNQGIEDTKRHLEFKKEAEEYKELEYRHWCLAAGVPYRGWLEFPNIQ